MFLGHKDAVDLLISKEANVNYRDYKNYTPLHYAALYGNFKLNTVHVQTNNYYEMSNI